MHSLLIHYVYMDIRRQVSCAHCFPFKSIIWHCRNFRKRDGWHRGNLMFSTDCDDSYMIPLFLFSVLLKNSVALISIDTISCSFIGWVIYHDIQLPCEISASSFQKNLGTSDYWVKSFYTGEGISARIYDLEQKQLKEMINEFEPANLFKRLASHRWIVNLILL